MVDMEWPGARQPEVPFLEVGEILRKLIKSNFCSGTCQSNCTVYHLRIWKI